MHNLLNHINKLISNQALIAQSDIKYYMLNNSKSLKYVLTYMPIICPQRKITKTEISFMDIHQQAT